MSRTIITVLMLLAASAGSMLSWAQSSASGSHPPTYIRGEIRDARTGRPLGYVRVILELNRYGYIDETYTDELGKFVFPNLSRSVYIVRIKLPGYKGTEQVTNACEPAGCRRVDLSASTMEYLTFIVTPTAPAGEPQMSSRDDLPIPEAAQNEFDKGRELARKGKAGDSIGHFRKAIDLYPSYQQAYFHIGIAYMDVMDWKGAESALLKAIELNPKDAAALLALGTAYANQKDFVSAEKPLVRGLELSPAFAEGHCQLSLVYWALSRFRESEPYAQRCAVLSPNYAQAHLLLGNLALNKRDQLGALREYKEYLRLAPAGAYALDVRQRIERLEKALAQQGQAN